MYGVLKDHRITGPKMMSVSTPEKTTKQHLTDEEDYHMQE